MSFSSMGSRRTRRFRGGSAVEVEGRRSLGASEVGVAAPSGEPGEFRPSLPRLLFFAAAEATFEAGAPFCIPHPAVMDWLRFMPGFMVCSVLTLNRNDGRQNPERSTSTSIGLTWLL